MDWPVLINREIVPLFGFVILLILLKNNTKMDARIKRTFFAVIGFALGEMAIFELEGWTASLSYPTFWRVLLSSLGYSLRPVIILSLIFIMNGIFVKRVKQLILSIPALVNILLSFTALFSDIVFSYSSDNFFLRGPLGYTAYIVSLFYLASFLVIAARFTVYQNQSERSIAILTSLFAVIATLLEYFDYRLSLMRVTMMLCIFFCYVLRQNNALFSLIDDVPGAVASYKISKGRLRLVSFNDTMCEMLGVSRAEYERVTRNSPFPYLQGERRKKAEENIALLIREHDNAEFEFRTGSSGDKKWLRAYLKVTKRTDDEININAIMVDITREKQTEDDLRMREKELSLSMSQMGKMICVYDAATRTLTMPAAYAEHHGLSSSTITVPDETISRKLVHGESANEYGSFYDRILAGERKGSGTYGFILPSGKECWERADFVTIFDEGGKPQRAIVAVEDVTEYHEKQLSLERYRSVVNNVLGDDKLFMEFDLAKRRLIVSEGSLFAISDDTLNGTLDQLAAHLAACHVRKEDSEFLTDFLNRANLLAAYHAGIKHSHIDRIMLRDDKSELWVRLSIDLSTSPGNGHIIASLLLEDVDAERREQEDLLSRANTDPLTGLLNRSAAMSEIERYLTGSGRDGTHALIMLDMDNLRCVNDKLGHQFGDGALQRFASELKQYFHSDDIIGRIGGDEFFAFIKNIQVDKISHKMIDLLQNLEFVYSDNDRQIETSANAGIAMYHGDAVHIKTLDELYNEADAALYKSKSNGKRTVSFVDAFDALAASSSSSPSFLKEEAVSFSLRGLFNRMSVGFAISRGTSMSNLKPIFCNDAFLKLTGLTREQFINEFSTNGDFIHPDDRYMVAGIRGGELKNGAMDACVFRLRKSDTKYRWVRTYGSVHALSDGTFDFYTVYIDIDQQAEQHRLQERINLGLQEALRKTHPDSAIEAVLEMLGTELCGERACIFERNEQGCDDNTYEWVAEGVRPHKDNLQNLPPIVCDIWYETLKKESVLIIRSVEDIRESMPAAYDILAPRGIHSLVVAPIQNESGKVVGFFGIHNPPAESLRSVSELMQTLALFVQSVIKRRNLLRSLTAKANLSIDDVLHTELFQIVMNETNDIIVVTDIETLDIIYANQAAQHFYGKTLGSSPMKCYQLRGLEGDCANCPVSAVSVGKRHIIETVEKGRHMRVGHSRIKWKGRDALILFQQDITEEAEARVRREKLLSNIPGALSVFAENKDGTVSRIFAGPKAQSIPCALSGDDSRKLDPDCFGIVYPEDRSYVSEAIEQTVFYKTLARLEFRLKSSSGEFAWVELDVNPIFDSGRWYYYCLYTEINDRKEIEITEQLNRQLTSELKVARHASKVKSEFLSRMSHDIRTPLNAIIGMTTFALHDIGDSKRVEEHLSKISSASQILLGLLNDILDTAAIESGKMTVVQQPFDLRDTMKAHEAVFSSRCADKGIDFRMETDNIPNTHLLGDSMRLGQVIMNLLSNAFKFTESGGKIRVAASELSRSEDEILIRIEVQDTGCGMSEELLGRLFNAFEQGDAMTAHKYGGSGLGLSIVKSLVALMNGSVSVQSTPGVGSTFTVDLPFSLDRSFSPDDAVSESEKKEWDFTGKRILIADDDAFNREVISGLLSMVGIQVEQTENGQQALDTYLRSNHFDAILLDVHMPIMDGHEAARAIRASSRVDAASIPIFALTADAFPSDVQKSLICGMTGHLAKPIDREALYALLDEVFAKRR